MRRRAPRPLAQALHDLRRAIAPATTLADLQAAWPAVTGPVIAAEAAPTAEHGGVVTVACRSAVWAHELELMGPDLVTRLNAALGRDAVRALRCQALAPHWRS